MEHKQLELFQQAVTACNVGCHIIFKDSSNLSQTDKGLRLRLYEDYNYQPLQVFLEQYVTAGSIVRYEDSFGMYYTLLHIPAAYLYDYESSHFVIGPYLENQLETAQIRKIMEQRRIPDNLFSDIRLVYSSTPVLHNMESFEALIVNLARGLFHVEYKVSHLPDKNEIFMEHSPLILKLRKEPQISNGLRVSGDYHGYCGNLYYRNAWSGDRAGHYAYRLVLGPLFGSDLCTLYLTAC